MVSNSHWFAPSPQGPSLEGCIIINEQPQPESHHSHHSYRCFPLRDMTIASTIHPRDTGIRRNAKLAPYVQPYIHSVVKEHKYIHTLQKEFQISDSISLRSSAGFPYSRIISSIQCCFSSGRYILINSNL